MPVMTPFAMMGSTMAPEPRSSTISTVVLAAVAGSKEWRVVHFLLPLCECISVHRVPVYPSRPVRRLWEIDEKASPKSLVHWNVPLYWSYDDELRSRIQKVEASRTVSDAPNVGVTLRRQTGAPAWSDNSQRRLCSPRPSAKV